MQWTANIQMNVNWKTKSEEEPRASVILEGNIKSISIRRQENVESYQKESAM